MIREHSVVSKNLTMGEKEKGASRFNLTGEQTVTFERFMRTFDGGKFLSTIMLRETSSNIQKKMAWEKFTTAFNAVCKTNFTRIQLHQYHSRVTAKKKKETRDRYLQLAAARRYASGTGGGPPGPSVEQADGDVIDDDVPPGTLPIRCALSTATSALGHTISEFRPHQLEVVEAVGGAGPNGPFEPEVPVLSRFLPIVGSQSQEPRFSRPLERRITSGGEQIDVYLAEISEEMESSEEVQSGQVLTQQVILETVNFEEEVTEDAEQWPLTPRAPTPPISPLPQHLPPIEQQVDEQRPAGDVLQQLRRVLEPVLPQRGRGGRGGQRRQGAGVRRPRVNTAMDEAYAQETRNRKKLLQLEFLSMQSNALLNRELIVKAATETALVRMQMEALAYPNRPPEMAPILLQLAPLDPVLNQTFEEWAQDRLPPDARKCLFFYLLFFLGCRKVLFSLCCSNMRNC